VLKIANEFVSEAAASEVASAGLNGIREICVRQPLAMDETLLQDLVQYRKSKDKGVMMAAKGLLSLYRNVGAEMLHKRDRGKDAALNLRDGGNSLPRFGETVVEDNIAGIELLEQWKAEQRLLKLGSDVEEDEIDEEKLIEEEDEEGWKNWEVGSNASEDSGGWIDVESDGEDIEVSDSDDEPSSKKKKVEQDDPPSTQQPQDMATPASTTVSEQTRARLATTRILTPADLAKLRELQQQSSIVNTMSGTKTARSRAANASGMGTRHVDDGLTAAEIEGLASLSHKATKEEKIAKAKADKEEKHVSSTTLRKEKKRAAGKSSTNKEKERQKNFLMTLRKAKSKGRRSLKDVRKAMKGHVERQKRGGRRGNIG
jgi:protein SDA1